MHLPHILWKRSTLKKYFLRNVLLFYAYEYFTCIYVCVPHVCLVPIEEGVGIPRTVVTDSCELPYGLWERNPGPLEKQPLLLTAEPSPQPFPNRPRATKM